MRGRYLRRAPARRRTRVSPSSLGAALLAAALSVACEEATSPPPEGAPNVVLILVDDLRRDAVGSLGPSPVETPNLDRLGDEGLWFESAFVVQSVCKPSRASFFTGLYPHAHGLRTNGGDWSRRHKNVFGALESLGYHIGYVGKWHLGGVTPPDWADRWVSFAGQGEYLDPLLNVDGRDVRRQGHMTDLLTEYATGFLRATSDRPFFLVVSHKAAHAPFTPQARWSGTVDASALELPPSLGDDLADQPTFVRERAAQVDRGRLVQRIREYYELVRGVDESVGRIVGTLEELGILDESLVIFAGDNGFLLGEHGLLDKRVAYEESIRVPLAVRYPAWFSGGERTDRFALNIDVPATIMHAVTGTAESFPFRFLGLGAEGVDRSLKLVADGADRPAFLYEYFREQKFPATPTMRAVRTRDFKYVRYEDGTQVEELYDLRTDPREMDNLVAEESYGEVLRALRGELARLRMETRDR